jgi:hypothetical protein
MFSFLHVIEKNITAVIANIVKQSDKIDDKEFKCHYPQQIDLDDLSLKSFSRKLTDCFIALTMTELTLSKSHLHLPAIPVFA